MKVKRNANWRREREDLSQQSNREEVAVRYLLGTLSETEREQLEEQYFSDDDEFENFEIAEDEAVDRYVRGKLTAREVESFEKILASSPRLVERVKLARILTNQIESRQQASEAKSQPVVEKMSWWSRWFGSGLQLTPAFRAAMVSATVLILLAGSGLIAGWINSRRDAQRLANEKAQIELQIARLQTDIANEKARTTDLGKNLQTKQDALTAMEKQLEELRARVPGDSRSTSTATIFTPIMLQSGSLRGGGSKSDFSLLPNSSAVEITLQLRTNDYPTYNVLVQTPEGRPVHRASGLRPRDSGSGPTISFRVAATKLRAGDYIVYLKSGSSNLTVDDFSFRMLSSK